MSTTKDQIQAFRQATAEVNRLLAPPASYWIRHPRCDWWQVLIALRAAAAVANRLIAGDAVPIEHLESAVYWGTYYVIGHQNAHQRERDTRLHDAIMQVVVQHIRPNSLTTCHSLCVSPGVTRPVGPLSTPGFTGDLTHAVFEAG